MATSTSLGKVYKISQTDYDTIASGSSVTKTIDGVSTTLNYEDNSIYLIENEKRLWYNSSPTSSFTAKSVTISDLAKYKYLVVFYKQATESYHGQYSIKFKNSYYTGLASKTSTTVHMSVNRGGFSGGAYIYSRGLTIDSATQVSFDVGKDNVASSYDSTNNSVIIPIEIWGTNSL